MSIKIKPEYPWLYAIASKVIATPIIGFVTLFYILSSIYKPASEVYPIGITILGTTAAFAAICLAVPDSVEGSATFRWAGEKFLHSTMLLVQCLMLVFVKSTITGSAIAAKHPWMGNAAIPTITFLFTLR